MIDLENVQSELLNPFATYISGNQFASIVVIKGRLETAIEANFEESSEANKTNQAFTHFTADGDALEKAFVALGWPRNCWLGVTLQPDETQPLDGDRLRELVEIVDPLIVVTLDESARKALIESYRAACTNLADSFLPGTTGSVLGRRFVSIEDFSAALSDSRKKQLAWAQLKQVKYP